MSYVFVRAAAYYSPLAGGVVDFPIGLKLYQIDGSWVSEDGIKALHDTEVMERFLADGSLQECEKPDAEGPSPADEEPAPEDSDPDEGLVQDAVPVLNAGPALPDPGPSVDRPAVRKPVQKLRAKA